MDLSSDEFVRGVNSDSAQQWHSPFTQVSTDVVSEKDSCSKYTQFEEGWFDEYRN
jgi:hypothetical protein